MSAHCALVSFEAVQYYDNQNCTVSDRIRAESARFSSKSLVRFICLSLGLSLCLGLIHWTSTSNKASLLVGKRVLSATPPLTTKPVFRPSVQGRQIPYKAPYLERSGVRKGVHKLPVRAMSDPETYKVHIPRVEAEGALFGGEPIVRTDLSKLKEGQEFAGVVVALVAQGAVVDIGADGLGLLRMSHVVNEANFTLGQQIEVKILHVDEKANQVELDVANTAKSILSTKVRGITTFKEGEFLQGTVHHVSTLGAYMDLGAGTLGLIHASDLDLEAYHDSDDGKIVLVPGDTISVRVSKVDVASNEIYLVLTTGPIHGYVPTGLRIGNGGKIPKRPFKVGMMVSGIIKALTSTGMILDVGNDDIFAYIHITRIHMEAPFSVGQKIEARVMRIMGSHVELTMLAEGVEEEFLESMQHKKPIKDFYPGQELEGIVVYTSPLGTFVDVGAQKFGMVEPGSMIDELDTPFPGQTSDAVKVGDHVKVGVLAVAYGDIILQLIE